MVASTAYDHGYSSVAWAQSATGKTDDEKQAAMTWAPATIRLHLGWLSAQLRINPDDEFRWGRYDALCDLLARWEPVQEHPLDIFARLPGLWRREA